MDLDSCAFQHLTNNSNLFIEDLHLKYLNFTIAGRKTFCTKNIGTIAIPLTNRFSITVKKVAYISEYDSNLILLGQLDKSKISYINNSNTITLIQKRQAIKYIKKD